MSKTVDAEEIAKTVRMSGSQESRILEKSAIDCFLVCSLFDTAPPSPEDPEARLGTAPSP